jgi:hypothetical protein
MICKGLSGFIQVDFEAHLYKTKSRFWRDLLFAVGIGYADITKIAWGKKPCNSFIITLHFAEADLSNKSFNHCQKPVARPPATVVKFLILVQPLVSFSLFKNSHKQVCD